MADLFMRIRMKAEDAASKVVKLLGNNLQSLAGVSKVSFANVGQAARAAGLDISKLATYEVKASEGAKRLEVIKAQEALAIKKASDAASSGKISAEQIALAQSRAALATEKVKVAQNALSNATQKVTAEEHRLSSALASSTSHINSFERALSSVRARASSFQSSLSSMGSRALEFGSKLGMSIFALRQIGQSALGVTQAIFASNASMEQTGTAFTTLLHSSAAAAKMLAGLWKFAAETPFEFPEIANSARQMLAFGFSADRVLPMLRNVGDAVSALGGGATEIDRVTLALGQMQAKGKVNAQDMMQLTEVGIPAWKLLADGMGVTTAEIMKMSEEGILPADKAINLLLDGMGKTFGGGMQAQAKTFNGLWSTFHDNIVAGWRAFTGPLFEQAKGGLIALGDLVSSPQFQQFAVNMGQKVGGAIQIVSNVISTQIVPAFQTANTWVGNFTGTGNMLIPVLAGLGAVVASILVPAMAALAIEVAIATWPFLAIAAAVAGLTAVFLHFYNSNAQFRTFINNIGQAITALWTTISTNFLPAMQQIGSFIQSNVLPVLVSIGAFLASVFVPLWQKLVEVFQGQILPAWNQLVAAIQPAIPFFQLLGMIVGGILVVALGILVGIIGGVISALAGLIGGLAQVLGGIIQIISGVFQVVLGIIGFFVDLFTGHFDKLGADLLHIGTGIVTLFVGIWQVISGIFVAAIGFISGLISGFISGIIGFFTHLWNMLVGHSIIPDMINGIIHWFASLPQRALDAVGSLLGKLAGFFGGLASQAWQWGTNIIKNIASSIINSIGSFLGNAMNSVGQFIADHLPHSPAKLGPLRDLSRQGSLIPEQVGEGMQAGLPHLERAVGAMTSLSFVPLPANADQMPILNLPPSTSSAVTSGGTVTNNYSFSITVNAPARSRDEAREIADKVEEILTKKFNRSGNHVTWTSGGRS